MTSEARYQGLLAKREVHLLEPISEEVARDVIAQLLFLQMEDAAKPIKLVINSPGGSVPESLAIADTIEFITCPLHTVGIGMVGGTALMLLAAGAKGHRCALNWRWRPPWVGTSPRKLGGTPSTP